MKTWHRRLQGAIYYASVCFLPSLSLAVFVRECCEWLYTFS